MGIFERIKSGVAGAIPVEDDLDMGDSQRVKNLPQSNDSNDAVPATEAQSLADSAEASAEGYADTEIENHRSNEVHDTNQPPAAHDNGAHTESYTTAAEAEAAAPVDSVNGQTGAVELSTDVPNQTQSSGIGTGSVGLGSQGQFGDATDSPVFLTFNASNVPAFEVTASPQGFDDIRIESIDVNGQTVYSGPRSVNTVSQRFGLDAVSTVTVELSAGETGSINYEASVSLTAIGPHSHQL